MAMAAVVMAVAALGGHGNQRWWGYYRCVFVQHCSHHGIVDVPGLVVIDCIVVIVALSMYLVLLSSTACWLPPALCWHLCQHCAGTVFIIMIASLHDIIVATALLLYPASSSSTVFTNIVICGDHRQLCPGVVSIAALASLPSLPWHHHPCHTGIYPLMILLLHVALLLQWHCHSTWPCSVHATCNLVIACGIDVPLSLFLCSTLSPYTVLPLSSVAVNADLPCSLLLLQRAFAWEMPDIKVPHPFLAALFALLPSLPYAASLPFWCH